MGSLTGEIDGCLEGVSKSVQVLFNVMQASSFDNSENSDSCLSWAILLLDPKSI